MSMNCPPSGRTRSLLPLPVASTTTQCAKFGEVGSASMRRNMRPNRLLFGGAKPFSAMRANCPPPGCSRSARAPSMACSSMLAVPSGRHASFC
jgi:hypothetical protein